MFVIIQFENHPPASQNAGDHDVKRQSFHLLVWVWTVVSYFQERT